MKSDEIINETSNFLTVLVKNSKKKAVLVNFNKENNLTLKLITPFFDYS